MKKQVIIQSYRAERARRYSEQQLLKKCGNCKNIRVYFRGILIKNSPLEFLDSFMEVTVKAGTATFKIL